MEDMGKPLLEVFLLKLDDLTKLGSIFGVSLGEEVLPSLKLTVRT